MIRVTTTVIQTETSTAKRMIRLAIKDSATAAVSLIQTAKAIDIPVNNPFLNGHGNPEFNH